MKCPVLNKQDIEDLQNKFREGELLKNLRKEFNLSEFCIKRYLKGIERNKPQGSTTRKINEEECLKRWYNGIDEPELAKRYHVTIKAIQDFLRQKDAGKFIKDKPGRMIRINTGLEFKYLSKAWR